MDIENIVNDTFSNEFDIIQYKTFLSNLFNTPVSKERNITNFIGKEYVNYIKKVMDLGTFRDNNNVTICFYAVELKDESSVYRARTMQRNLIAKLLKQSSSDHALVAFYDLSNPDWRFSYIHREFTLTEKGPKEKLSPAKRHSFLVGLNEPNHTCKKQFLSKMIQNQITVEEIKESFDIETVTKEFFDEYKKLFDKLDKSLKKLVKNDELIKKEFDEKNIQTTDFAKKIMGQIVFLYFIQKKGWLGVTEVNEEGKPRWGTGPKIFMKKLYNGDYVKYDNFFNDVLEHLFYKGLSEDVTHYHYEDFNCYVPFLNGGLFENINGYNWEETDILLDNNIFEEIFDTFDTFNFTIKEDEPLDKEVAVDPEMLGKVFEKLLSAEERGPTGSFYTPRQVVSYMCKKSLIEYLATNSSIDKENIEQFIENGYLALDTILRYQNDIDKYGQAYTEINLPESIINNAYELDKLLKEVKIVDPAVGSGAFPVGMMYELVNSRYLLNLIMRTPLDLYELKRETIDNSLYGVDISYSATDITKLRFWLSLIVDEEIIEPLPNLDNKILCGNSLVEEFKGIKIYDKNKLENGSGQLSLDLKYNTRGKFQKLEKIKHNYFNEKSPNKKHELKEQINELKWEFILSSVKDNIASNEESFMDELNEIKNNNSRPFFIWELEFSEVFQKDNPGFDIVIGNPPYVSSKKIKSADTKIKKIYEDIYGIKDDLYNYFFIKSYELLKKEGVLSFITSNTYFTLNTKSNLRHLFQNNKIINLVDIKNVFDDPEVEPAIMICKKEIMSDNYIFKYIDAKTSFDSPKTYDIEVDLYKKATRNIFFTPSEQNMNIYSTIFKDAGDLLTVYWDKIRTSRDIEKNSDELTNYRNSLKNNDLTLLGLVVEGGVGLQTGDNGKFVGVLEGTDESISIFKNRPEKLFKAIQKNNIEELSNIQSLNDSRDYLNKLSETEIWGLFDSLKLKYGNNIFGKGVLYKIIPKELIFDIKTLNEDLITNGISDKKIFVPYDKGDKKGNRWLLNTPYYLDWSKDSVKFLKDNSGKKGKGMPVVRNPKFYFKEGFCWNNVLNPNSKYIKCRLKSISIHDVASMSLFPLKDNITAKYIVCLLNSMFLFKYQRTFINNTVNLQMNDFKQMPIIVPSEDQLKFFESLFDKAYSIKEDYFNEKISKDIHDTQLDEVQKILDKEVYKLYGLTSWGEGE